MLDFDALLRPIPGDNPSGRSLKHDPVYDSLKEARRQDDDAPAGVWERPLKKSDWHLARKLSLEALTARTKDLQIAAWLTEALIYLEGWTGLSEGVHLTRELIEKYWESVYPLKESGDLELRAAPLNRMGAPLDSAIRRIRITPDGLTWLQFQESRVVGSESDAIDSGRREQREQAIEEGKLSAELFDKSFSKGNWTFYKAQLDAMEAALAEVNSLDNVCEERFASFRPSFLKLRNSIIDVQQVVEKLSARLRPPDEIEPEASQQDESLIPVPVNLPSSGQTSPQLERRPVTSGGAVAVPARIATSQIDSADTAMAAISAAAAFLRAQDEVTPAPFLLLRGFGWGELRDALHRDDHSMLAAPSTETRQKLKSLATDESWTDLLEEAEKVMAEPSGRAWLDLQRYVVAACNGLGGQYENVVAAIRSELATLIADCPSLPELELTDGTQAANAETLRWLKDFLPAPAAQIPDLIDPPESNKGDADVYELALEIAAHGKPEDAVSLLWKAAQESTSGRSRFLRRLQIADVCLRTGAISVARSILEDLVAEMEARKLSEWESAETASRPLRLLYDCLSGLDIAPERRQQLHAIICRLHPAEGLAISG